MIRDVRHDGFTPNELPWKFEAGHPADRRGCRPGGRVDYLESVGHGSRPRNTRSTSRRMPSRRLADRFGDDLTIFGPTDTEERGGVLSFAYRDVHPHDLAQVLDQSGVCVRAGPPLRQTAHAPAGRHCHGPGLVLRLQRRVRRRHPGRGPDRGRYPVRVGRPEPCGTTGPTRSRAHHEEHMTGLEDLYREIILDHYRSPRNRGELPAPPAHRVEGFNPLCGDEVVVYVDWTDGTLTDIRISGQGCSISQSSASLMSAAVKGKTLAEVRDSDPHVQGHDVDPRGPIWATQTRSGEPERPVAPMRSVRTLRI